MTVDDDLRSLSTAYAAAVDGLDGAAFAALFTGDGELWVPDPRRGPDPIHRRSGRAELERIPAGLARYHVTHHTVWSTRYAVTGGEATGEVTGVAHHLAADGDGPGDRATGRAVDDGPGTDTVWYLRYEDAYRRTGSGWRIARRALHLRDLEVRAVARLGPGRRP